MTKKQKYFGFENPKAYHNKCFGLTFDNFILLKRDLATKDLKHAPVLGMLSLALNTNSVTYCYLLKGNII